MSQTLRAEAMCRGAGWAETVQRGRLCGGQGPGHSSLQRSHCLRDAAGGCAETQTGSSLHLQNLQVATSGAGRCISENQRLKALSLRHGAGQQGG